MSNPFIDDFTPAYQTAMAKGLKQMQVRVPMSRIREHLEKLPFTPSQRLRFSRIAAEHTEPVAVRLDIQDGSGFGSLFATALTKFGPALTKATPLLTTIGKNLTTGATTALGQIAMQKIMGGEIDGTSEGSPLKEQSRYIHQRVPLTEHQLTELGVAARNDHSSLTLRLDKEQIAMVANPTEDMPMISLTQRQVSKLAKAHAKSSGADLKFSKAQLKSMKRRFRVQDGEGAFQDALGDLFKVAAKGWEAAKKSGRKVKEVIENAV